MRILLDTNAYRAFLKGDPECVGAVKTATKILFSVVVLGELEAGFSRGTRGQENRRILSQILLTNRVDTVGIQESTSLVFGRVWSELRQKGRPIPTNDVWIAAQCLEHGFALLTLDKHFQEIEGLALLPRGLPWE